MRENRPIRFNFNGIYEGDIDNVDNNKRQTSWRDGGEKNARIRIVKFAFEVIQKDFQQQMIPL